MYEDGALDEVNSFPGSVVPMDGASCVTNAECMGVLAVSSREAHALCIHVPVLVACVAPTNAEGARDMDSAPWPVSVHDTVACRYHLSRDSRVPIASGTAGC